MVDPATCVLYELYDAHYVSATASTAGSGAIWSLNSNALRPATWTSADAAGLPILPGLLLYQEVLSGKVGHAIRFTAECTDESLSGRRVTRPDPAVAIIPLWEHGFA